MSLRDVVVFAAVSKIWLRDGEVVRLSDSEIPEYQEDQVEDQDPGQYSVRGERDGKPHYTASAEVVSVVHNRSRGNVTDLRPGATVTAVCNDDMFVWVTPWPPEVGNFVRVMIE